MYEFHRDAALDARNYFDLPEIPPFTRNQFGASLGGPLRKQRTFFFINYEGFRESKSITATLSVPDDNARRGLLPSAANPNLLVNVGVDPRIAPFLALYPRSNAGSLGGGLASWAAEPGLGKTALVETFLASLAKSSDCTVMRGRCSERLAGTEAYLPFLDALEGLLHSNRGESCSRIMKVLAPSWYLQITPSTSEDETITRLAEMKALSQERLKREMGTFLRSGRTCSSKSL